jgi:hypothetical protein
MDSGVDFGLSISGLRMVYRGKKLPLFPHRVHMETGGMICYAHTAEGPDGKLLPEEHWQPLAEHLRNVANLAKQFAAPLDLASGAELAGQTADYS